MANLACNSRSLLASSASLLEALPPFCWWKLEVGVVVGSSNGLPSNVAVDANGFSVSRPRDNLSSAKFVNRFIQHTHGFAKLRKRRQA